MGDAEIFIMFVLIFAMKALGSLRPSSEINQRQNISSTNIVTKINRRNENIKYFTRYHVLKHVYACVSFEENTNIFVNVPTIASLNFSSKISPLSQRREIRKESLEESEQISYMNLNRRCKNNAAAPNYLHVEIKFGETNVRNSVLIIYILFGFYFTRNYHFTNKTIAQHFK